MMWLFQSTPPHGGEPQMMIVLRQADSFNPRPRTGANRDFRPFFAGRHTAEASLAPKAGFAASNMMRLWAFVLDFAPRHLPSIGPNISFELR
jgi:hypothetical protein